MSRPMDASSSSSSSESDAELMVGESDEARAIPSASNTRLPVVASKQPRILYFAVGYLHEREGPVEILAQYDVAVHDRGAALRSLDATRQDVVEWHEATTLEQVIALSHASHQERVAMKAGEGYFGRAASGVANLLSAAFGSTSDPGHATHAPLVNEAFESYTDVFRAQLEQETCASSSQGDSARDKTAVSSGEALLIVKFRARRSVMWRTGLLHSLWTFRRTGRYVHFVLSSVPWNVGENALDGASWPVLETVIHTFHRPFLVSFENAFHQRHADAVVEDLGAGYARHREEHIGEADKRPFVVGRLQQSSLSVS